MSGLYTDRVGKGLITWDRIGSSFDLRGSGADGRKYKVSRHKTGPVWLKPPNSGWGPWQWDYDVLQGDRSGGGPYKTGDDAKLQCERSEEYARKSDSIKKGQATKAKNAKAKKPAPDDPCPRGRCGHPYSEHVAGKGCPRLTCQHSEVNGKVVKVVGGIQWSVITKKTVVPGLEIEKGKKYFVDSGELGIGKRTMYLLRPHGAGKGFGSLGIVCVPPNGIAYPGAFTSVEKARAAAAKHERTGEPVHGDWSAPVAKPVHPSLKVIKCICEHTKSRHRGAWGEPNAGNCRDCVCEQFELEEKKGHTQRIGAELEAKVEHLAASAFVWKKEWSKKAHPAANLFPMLSEAELDALGADIKANGLHEPIILTSDDLVLDGRNRLEGCKRAKIEPDFQLWEREQDGISPTAWAISKNLHRRHLTPSQAAMVAVDALPLLEKEARARQRAGAAKGGAASKVSAPVRQASLLPDVVPEKVTPAKKPAGKAAAVAAQATGVSTRLVEQAKSVLAKAPAAEVAKIRTGEKTLKQVDRETKRAEQVANVKVYVAPVGEYEVISVDPSWPFDDALDGEGARGGLVYPPMTLEEICALKIPAAKDCLLVLWITNTHLIAGDHVPVLKAWGFTGKTIFTWNKVHFGAGRTLRNATEHCIFALRGKPIILGESTSTLSPPWPRTGPSVKPAEFYKMLEQICPAQSRLEMFACAPRPGWTTSGSELTQPTALAQKQQDWVNAMADVVDEVFPPQRAPARLQLGPGEVPSLEWRVVDDGTNDDVFAIGRTTTYRVVAPKRGAKSHHAEETRWLVRTGPIAKTGGKREMGRFVEPGCAEWTGKWGSPGEAKYACEKEEAREIANGPAAATLKEAVDRANDKLGKEAPSVDLIKEAMRQLGPGTAPVELGPAKKKRRRLLVKDEVKP